ncbi:OmpA family protein [Flavobacterium sp. SM15]|uniref:OmpA family protein n=1 Tax=Flavobacterium sp. SM15 TaxID=2908005 RepID=UPI001EDB2B43|nr:OmpA family protein [Flavobacterium sp. SM15]MCG2612523.1 OmpA family protein [Flavobacterium sp. SM15]
MRLCLILFLFLISNCYSQEKVTVYFDFDIHRVNVASGESLQDWMQQNKNAEILKIYGFCDSVGSFEYNDRLSDRRVNDVFTTLKNNHFSFSKRFESKGFGKRFKQSKTQDENRKVEIYFQVKEEKLSDKIQNVKTGDKLRLKNLNFYNNSGVVVPKSIPVLEELLAIMRENPKLKIAIQGHICCQPQGDINDISTLRASSVYNYLTENGIHPSRLSYIGFGSTMPLYPIPEQNEFEKDENRRVEIQIIENK